MSTTTTTSSSTSTTTTQPFYSGDSDLTKIRPNILGLGVSSWPNQHEAAQDYINRDLDTGWYRSAASRRNIDFHVAAFAPSYILDVSSQLKDLSVYKVLELVYEFLAKDSTQDEFLELSKLYAKKYEVELKRVISRGIDYDWDGTGLIESDERYSQKFNRRLTRA